MENVGISFENICTVLELVKTTATPPVNYICCSNKANAAMYCADTVIAATNIFGIGNVADIGVCDQDSTAVVCNS